MSETQAAPAQPQGAGTYRIRIEGHLADRWAGWFDGLTLTRHGDGTTLIEGPVVDQAALHGLLQKVRDTGLRLVCVTCLPSPHQAGESSPADPTIERSSS